MSAKKAVTREVAEEATTRSDMEGIWYALKEGYLDCLHGTVLEKTASEAKVAMLKLEKALDALREKYDIQEQ